MKRAKRYVREFFTAVLRGNELRPSRGCWRVVGTLGESIEEKSTRESHRQLTANLGDRLMIFGPSTDEIAIVSVKWIKVEGWTATLFVERGCGEVNDGGVKVLKLKRAAA